MRIKQISASVENKIDGISEITNILSTNGINIRASLIADTAEFGILRMIVDDPDRAVKVLEEAGIAVKISEVIAVEMPDKTGGLSAILSVLSGRGINLEYVYAFVGRGDTGAMVVFKADDQDAAERIIAESGVADINASSVFDSLK